MTEHPEHPRGIAGPFTFPAPVNDPSLPPTAHRDPVQAPLPHIPGAEAPKAPPRADGELYLRLAGWASFIAGVCAVTTVATALTGIWAQDWRWGQTAVVAMVLTALSLTAAGAYQSAAAKE